MKAPSFSLPDQSGKIHSLSDYQGKWIILYFYPKDDTPGCTREACEFRDTYKTLTNLNVIVLGISKDSIVSHGKFAKKYNLPFPLLSDETLQTIKAYNAWGEKKFIGKTYEGILRKTFLIGPDGKIAKEYKHVLPLGHAGVVIEDLRGFLQ
ncbi:MAG: thioredoxin-dependent thiol peroxidase [bacterium]|nr:thioredoxin-dependent thiol peroxidase [bacterium]